MDTDPIRSWLEDLGVTTDDIPADELPTWASRFGYDPTRTRCESCAASMPAGRSRTGCRVCHRRPEDRAYRVVLGGLPSIAGTISHGGTPCARRRAAVLSRLR